jgi:hypothetical protein
MPHLLLGGKCIPDFQRVRDRSTYLEMDGLPLFLALYRRIRKALIPLPDQAAAPGNAMPVHSSARPDGRGTLSPADRRFDPGV